MMIVVRTIMKVTKTKSGVMRCGPFSSGGTLNSYLRLYTLPVKVKTKNQQWIVESRDAIEPLTSRWKKTSPKDVAYIEMCDWVGDHSRKKIAS